MIWIKEFRISPPHVHTNPQPVATVALLVKTPFSILK